MITTAKFTAAHAPKLAICFLVARELAQLRVTGVGPPFPGSWMCKELCDELFFVCRSILAENVDAPPIHAEPWPSRVIDYFFKFWVLSLDLMCSHCLSALLSDPFHLNWSSLTKFSFNWSKLCGFRNVVEIWKWILRAIELNIILETNGSSCSRKPL